MLVLAFTNIAWSGIQGSGKDLIQPVLDNQLKAASPLLVPAKVGSASSAIRTSGHLLEVTASAYVGMR